MKGLIQTYLPEKQYGFIKGDDGKDYFFHDSEFHDQEEKQQICEEAYVSFDQQATPKGYKATRCAFVNRSGVVSYITPDKIVLSQSSKVASWEILQLGNWMINSSSSDSPSGARRELREKAALIGANALIHLDYFKTTGSRGNYNYTVHNYRAQPVIVGRKNANGHLLLDDLGDINRRAEALKNELKTKYDEYRKKMIIAVITGIIFTLITQAISVTVIIFIIGYKFFRKTPDYGSWLEDNW